MGNVDEMGFCAMTGDFLPVNRATMEQRGWESVDFVLVTGDAYVDHPSFGAAIIGRWLEAHGFRVAILPQPDWRNALAFKEFGRPRLGFLVTGGNLDSLLSNYTASGKPRRSDAYSPGGVGGSRPDRASIVYSGKIKEIYKGIPVILGGIEASLRRFAHYDYRDNRVRRSILFDSRADLLIFGMGEAAILKVARRLKDGSAISEIRDVPGTAFISSREEADGFENCLQLPSFQEVEEDPRAFSAAVIRIEQEQNPFSGRTLAQLHKDRYLIQNPPHPPLSTEELDLVYSLPYTKKWHPIYEQRGGVPALSEVLFSLTAHRGCFGGCSFCALTLHQGKMIAVRSDDSLLEEARSMVNDPRFKGYIHDVGGPTANFHRNACRKMDEKGPCNGRNCVTPRACKKLDFNHADYLGLLRKMREIPGVKKIFIRSGIRYDYLLGDDETGDSFLRELCQHHVSGQLKVAPEHVSEHVLRLMGKGKIHLFNEFKQKFENSNRAIKKEQYLVPYFMSSHPGSTLDNAIELAEYIRDMGVMPEQVQDFIPAPGSLSTAMYYTGFDLMNEELTRALLRHDYRSVNPDLFRKIYVARTPEEREMQRALLQFKKPENRNLILKALKKAGREELIGKSKRALVAGGPERPAHRRNHGERAVRYQPSATGNSRGFVKKKGRGS